MESIDAAHVVTLKNANVLLLPLPMLRHSHCITTSQSIETMDRCEEIYLLTDARETNNLKALT